MFKGLKKIIIVSVCLLSMTSGLFFNAINTDASDPMRGCYSDISNSFSDVFNENIELVRSEYFDYIFLGKAQRINDEGLLEFDVKYVYKGEVGEKISVDVFNDDIKAKYSLKYKKIVEEKKRLKLEQEKKLGKDYIDFDYAFDGCDSCRDGDIKFGQQYRVYANYSQEEGEYGSSSCSVIEDSSNPLVVSAILLFVIVVLFFLISLKFWTKERMKTAYALRTGIIVFVVCVVIAFISAMPCEFRWINSCGDNIFIKVLTVPILVVVPFQYAFMFPSLIPGAFRFNFLHFLGLVVGFLLSIVVMYLFGYLIRLIAGFTVKMVKKITKR